MPWREVVTERLLHKEQKLKDQRGTVMSGEAMLANQQKSQNVIPVKNLVTYSRTVLNLNKLKGNLTPVTRTAEGD